MLKIYIQIFGTIALVAIILINYNFFYKTPVEEEIAKQKLEVVKLDDQLKTMDGIIAHAGKIAPVEQQIDDDKEVIELELPPTFSVPDKIKRIYELIIASELEYKGIIAQSVQRANPRTTVADFIAKPGDPATFSGSIDAFKTTMAALEGGTMTKFLNAENPAERATFYIGMTGSSKAWKPKAPLAQGFERHRYQLSGLTGSYANIKRFLWMVSQDKPLMQATSVRITPRTGVGETRPFTLDVTIVAYVDRNTVYAELDQDPEVLLKVKSQEAAAAAAAAPAAAAAAPAAAAKK